jgi:hypothetical protein
MNTFWFNELFFALFRNKSPLNPAEPGSGTVGYKEGLTIKTGLTRETVDNDYYIGSNYRLTLPARSSSGQCIWAAPVQFLKDTEETCVWRMKEDLCGSQSVLNALMYVQDPNWTGLLGPLILERQGVKAVTVTNIDYYCIETNTTRYLQSTERYADRVQKNTVYSFGYTLPRDEFDEVECDFDPDSGVYVCQNQTTGDLPTEAPLNRCPWDDGTQKPPIPVYDNVTLLCSNAVVDVQYTFRWTECHSVGCSNCLGHSASDGGENGDSVQDLC